MMMSRFGRYALGAGLALAVLAGCGASQQLGAPSAIPPSAIPQGAITAQNRAYRPLASDGDLIYAAYGNVVYVFTYPAGGYVGRFTVAAASITGLCSDANGDVFITTFYVPYSLAYVYEYVHGGTKPTKTLGLSAGYAPFGCSRDPKTGNLATAIDMPGSDADGVAVFKKLHGVPTYYKESKFSDLRSVTYDGSGNLFAQDRNSEVFELPHGGSTFTKITLPGSVRGEWYIQWDGSNLAIMSGKVPHIRIARVQVVGSRGKVTGTTTFADLTRDSAVPPSFWIQGSTVLLQMGRSEHAYRFGIYPYPAGGNPETVISGYEVAYFTVSATSRSHTRT